MPTSASAYETNTKLRNIKIIRNIGKTIFETRANETCQPKRLDTDRLDNHKRP